VSILSAIAESTATAAAKVSPAGRRLVACARAPSPITGNEIAM
jgi:hypothetical protein